MQVPAQITKELGLEYVPDGLNYDAHDYGPSIEEAEQAAGPDGFLSLCMPGIYPEFQPKL